MSETKVQMPLYILPSVLDDIDNQRTALADSLGVPSISRGDYITRLIKLEHERNVRTEEVSES